MKNILNKIKIDNSTYILLLLGLIAGYIKNYLIIMIIILIHELGHVFFFKIFKIEIESITIYPFGGITKINNKLHERIYKEILISIGGIMFQLLLLVVFYLLYSNNLIVLNTYLMFLNYNSSIILFNLLPIIPLDGSKLVFNISKKYMSYKKSYILMILIGIVSYIMFLVYNFIYRINDIVVYLFLLYEIYLIIKNYKLIMNRFYLERVIYDNYFDKIVYCDKDIDNIRIDKYYYFLEKDKYINEKKYIKNKKFSL